MEMEFKEWHQQDSNDKDSSYCKACKVKLKNASNSMLLKHKNSVKQKRSFEFAKGSVDIIQFLRKKATTESYQIAKSEIMFAVYFAEHNIPFANIDHLLDVCKLVFPDCKIAKNLSMKRTKLSYVIQDGTAFEKTRFVADISMNQKFSIIIHESTDISTVQVLAVVVRYFDSKKEDVVDALLNSIIVETGTASGLYDAVKLLLRRKNISIENIFGFGSGNCSSMMGKKSGFPKLLKNDVPNVFIMGFVCHSFALYANHAVHVLPSYLAFLKNLATYFSCCSKR